MDADEQALWRDIGHFAGLSAAGLQGYDQADFRIRAEQTDERNRLAITLRAGVLQRLSAHGIAARGESWYDDAESCYTFAIKRTTPGHDTTK